MKLYHYEHCPFCQRVRLFLGYKNIPYEKILLSYDDQEIQKKLIGHRGLPIIEFDDGTVMNESMDILREIEMRYPNPIGFVGPVEAKFQWSSMVMTSLPRYFDILLPAYETYYSAEFEKFPEGKKYFVESKEKKRGKNFSDLRAETPKIFKENILPTLEKIIDIVEDEFFLMGPTFSVADCVLAADLSGIRLIDNITIPTDIKTYIRRVERHCRTDLLLNQGV